MRPTKPLTDQKKTRMRKTVIAAIKEKRNRMPKDMSREVFGAVWITNAQLSEMSFDELCAILRACWDALDDAKAKAKQW
jgi:hypothetical protein